MPRKKKEEPALVAYKAMNADMTCKGHKFEVGQTYTVEGKPVLCKNGFHVCENPLDVLNHYDLVGSRFTRATLTGEVVREAGGRKACGTTITIDAELSLPEWIAAGVKWMMDACKSGGNVHATSGDCSRVATSGDCSQVATSGYSSQVATSGNSSRVATSGNSSRVEVAGTNSVAVAAAPNSRIKAVAGTWVAIPEFDRHGKCIGGACGFVGQDGIPADVWLTAKGGKLVEAA